MDYKNLKLEISILWEFFKIIQIFSRQINKFPKLNLNTFLIISFVKAKIAISKE